MLVHIVADYGMGDFAFAEVVQRTKVHPPDVEPLSTPAPAGRLLIHLLSTREPAGDAPRRMHLRTERHGFNPLTEGIEN
ncbi:MAG: hypothetical protein P0111_08010 [Nitrospira sp.]|nr:hypothetical protein [Nitrospira sp.]